jgi:ABC-2 type transport system ATP-binding protein
MSGSAPAILAESLVKSFGQVRAVKGLDLFVPAGTIFGMLGPNGAGKTTTVRMLTTLLRPDSGRATVLGFDVVRQAQAVRRVLGLSGQFAALDYNLTGRENLRMIGRLYGLDRRTAAARTDEMLARFDLEDAADRVVKTYSGGMRRRLDLGCSLIGRPAVLLLDEPTTGLDPAGRIGTWDMIVELVAEGTTVLLTTQYLEEADRLAQEIVVVDRGAVIAHGSPDELKDRVGGERVEVLLAGREKLETAAEALARIDRSDVQVDQETRRLLVSMPSGSPPIAEIVRRLDVSGVAIEDLVLRRPTLDDAFLALTGHTAADDARPAPVAPTAGKVSL